jgi:hypothetical protein
VWGGAPGDPGGPWCPSRTLPRVQFNVGVVEEDGGLRWQLWMSREGQGMAGIDRSEDIDVWQEA